MKGNDIDNKIGDVSVFAKMDLKPYNPHYGRSWMIENGNEYLCYMQ